MSSPLPNIIMLGDFNFPGINWLNPDYNGHDASPLILFSDLIFLNQQVSAPTRKSNILDLIFSPDDFINCIDITDFVINDIISKSQAIILSMSSPLPNIIMLEDFNFPDINWLNPDYNCHDTSPLILFSDLIFLNQRVSAPTRKSNILDLIFFLMIL